MLKEVSKRRPSDLIVLEIRVYYYKPSSILSLKNKRGEGYLIIATTLYSSPKYIYIRKRQRVEGQSV